MSFTPQRFTFQGQVPMASIIQAFQQRQQMEQQQRMQAEQMKRQKHQDLLQTIQMGSQLVQQGVELSKSRQMASSRRAFAELLANQDDLIPMGPGGTAHAMGQEVPIAQMGRMGDTQAWKSQAQAAFMKAYPEEGTKQMGRQLFKEGPSELEQAKTAEIRHKMSPEGQQQQKPPSEAAAVSAARQLQNAAQRQLNQVKQVIDDPLTDKTKFIDKRGNYTAEGLAMRKNVERLVEVDVKAQARLAEASGVAFTEADIQKIADSYLTGNIAQDKEKRSFVAKLKEKMFGKRDINAPKALDPDSFLAGEGF